MSVRDGGPAFPGTIIAREGMWGTAPAGMTLRDYFAAAALTGMLVNPDGSSNEARAIVAYRFADALLAERGRMGK